MKVETVGRMHYTLERHRKVWLLQRQGKCFHIAKEWLKKEIQFVSNHPVDGRFRTEWRKLPDFPSQAVVFPIVTIHRWLEIQNAGCDPKFSGSVDVIVRVAADVEDELNLYMMAGAL